MENLTTYKSQFAEKKPKIAKHILTGIHEYAKTFGIMTAENPMGLKISSSENKKRNTDLWDYLKYGRYQFVKIKGKYGNIENPVIIINIPLKELLYLGDKYNQESIIYGTINDYRKVTFDYWERNSENSPMIKKDSIDRIDVLSDPKDFYSRIKNWKFTIPFPIFQESLLNWYEDKIQILNENEKENIKVFINKIIEPSNKEYTGHHYYSLRGNVNRIINVAKQRG